jgi:hypothetical protein
LIIVLFLINKLFVQGKLHWIRIYFAVPTFDRFTKDEKANFVDKLSAIGGTMGLLTGFSIISGVEIIYFGFKIAAKFFRKWIEKNRKRNSLKTV